MATAQNRDTWKKTEEAFVQILTWILNGEVGRQYFLKRKIISTLYYTTGWRWLKIDSGWSGHSSATKSDVKFFLIEYFSDLQYLRCIIDLEFNGDMWATRCLTEDAYKSPFLERGKISWESIFNFCKFLQIIIPRVL